MQARQGRLTDPSFKEVAVVQAGGYKGADYFLKIFKREKWLDFGNGAKLGKVGFNDCIDLLVKLKGGIKHHTKVFEMGFNESGQVAKNVGNHFDEVRGQHGTTSDLLSFNCKKFCSIQHLMSSRQFMRMIRLDRSFDFRGR